MLSFLTSFIDSVLSISFLDHAFAVLYLFVLVAIIIRIIKF